MDCRVAEYKFERSGKFIADGSSCDHKHPERPPLIAAARPGQMALPVRPIGLS